MLHSRRPSKKTLAKSLAAGTALVMVSVAGSGCTNHDINTRHGLKQNRVAIGRDGRTGEPLYLPWFGNDRTPTARELAWAAHEAEGQAHYATVLAVEQRKRDAALGLLYTPDATEEEALRHLYDISKRYGHMAVIIAADDMETAMHTETRRLMNERTIPLSPAAVVVFEGGMTQTGFAAVTVDNNRIVELQRADSNGLVTSLPVIEGALNVQAVDESVTKVAITSIADPEKGIVIAPDGTSSAMDPILQNEMMEAYTDYLVSLEPPAPEPVPEITYASFPSGVKALSLIEKDGTEISVDLDQFDRVMQDGKMVGIKDVLSGEEMRFGDAIEGVKVETASGRMASYTKTGSKFENPAPAAETTAAPEPAALDDGLTTSAERVGDAGKSPPVHPALRHYLASQERTLA